MQWHDVLGAVLIDFFSGSPFVVDMEIDLSLKKQYLDLLVIRRGEGEFHRPLPDGQLDHVQIASGDVRFVEPPGTDRSLRELS